MQRMQQATHRVICWIGVAVALQLVGCMAQQRRNLDIDRTPIVNTGARASIIYPGDGPIPMPGTEPRRSSPQTARGGQRSWPCWAQIGSRWPKRAPATLR